METKRIIKNKISPLVAQSIGNLVAAFGLIAALAWNEAVKSLINNFIPQGQGTLSLFIYAISVTLLAVIVGARLMNIKVKFEKEEIEQE